MKEKKKSTDDDVNICLGLRSGRQKYMCISISRTTNTPARRKKKELLVGLAWPGDDVI